MNRGPDVAVQLMAGDEASGNTGAKAANHARGRAEHHEGSFIQPLYDECPVATPARLVRSWAPE